MNTPKLVSLGLLTLAIAQFTGCAMVKKTSSAGPAAKPDQSSPVATASAAATKAPVMDNILIQSTPSGATVSINGNNVGVTPYTTTLDRAQTYALCIKQPGFMLYGRTLKAEAKVTGGQTNKAGFMTFSSAQIPGKINVTLRADKDPYKALEAAVAKLDSQSQRHQIGSDEYKQRLAEVTDFYGRGK